ncbi:MAG TPA: 3-phosphoshikimate 1-carboxyvinyltransferase [Gaiellaceae bacterium]|nr:3-phosphoshikimate 1-carboxyvinyltransferase [Gaiellaceae bacterium]
MKIEPAAQVHGHVAVPGDKSISHRAVLLGAVADGETRVRGFGRSEDTLATVEAMRTLGAEVQEEAADELVVGGVGLRGLRGGIVDCANAGTLMRLLAGLAAGQPSSTTLTGDASLSQRPMERIAQPLREMGAAVETTDGHAPVSVDGTDALHGIRYELPVASAQVKSAVLLAGLNANGPTTVVEPAPTRDHTELMLEAAGVSVLRKASAVTVQPAGALRLGEVVVPGDFSSAAPLVAAAVLVPTSDLTIHDVNVNPRRTGLLDVLDRMGAHVAVFNRRRAGREWVADVQVQHSELNAVEVAGDEVPSLVDELPLVALLAAHARGRSVIRGAGELRVKETDRIEAVTEPLRSWGAHIRSRDDGWEITGVPARLRGGKIDARGDHRIAMLGAVAGLASREGVEVEGAESVAVSFPGFFELLESVVRR